MADETRELAKFVAGLTFGHIPDHVRARATDILVDQIGCQIGCSALPWAMQVRDMYKRSGGTPEATVVRYGDRLPITSVAFINSTFGHSFEFDDANPLIHGHPGAELIPSLVAIGEREHVSGRDFLTAFIAAYELRGRIGWAVNPDMLERGGPQSSTACGPFGVAAGVARLLGLGDDGIRNALGIAGCFSGGLKQYDQGGGSAKRIFAAVAASSGLQAALLAQAGMTGPEGILEGVHGLLRIYAKTFRPEQLVADFEKMWTIDRVLFKPYCCCAVIHPAIDGLKKVIASGAVTANDITSIDVSYGKGYVDHARITNPHDLLEMQFSTSYCLALTLVKGRNTPAEYTLESMNDPEVRAAASKVNVQEESQLSEQFRGHMSARTKVRTRSGNVYEELVVDARGSPEVPLSSAEIDDKFRLQVAGVFGTEHCETLLRVLRDVIALDDLAKLPAMFVMKKGGRSDG